MKNFIYKSGMLALFAGVLLTSCDPEIDTVEPTSGNADFSNYVALGNSLTAGFADGALYLEGQQNSYPSILAQQFALVGGDENFTQPLVPAGVSLGSPRPNAQGQLEVPQRRVLAPIKDCKDVIGLSPVEAGAPAPFPQAFFAATPTVQGPYNNLGVPGAKSFHLLAPGYGNPQNLSTGRANPFYVRFASSPETSVLADALAQNPTFFTLWIGNNDVLGYALAGGIPEPPTQEKPSSDYPTDPAIFKQAIDFLVTQLTSNGAKGALGNIPDVSKIPYFTTVPYNGLVLNADDAAKLTQAYGGAVKFQAGPNPFIIKEDGVTRPIKPTELILLSVPQDAIKCQGLGSVTPIDDKYVLSEAELAIIKQHTDSYNTAIKSAAAAKGLALADFNNYLNKVAKGINISGVTYSSTFVTGNIFSLDGIHFTPRGAALVANEFIDVINKTYSASIPKVNELEYRAVKLP